MLPFVPETTEALQARYQGALTPVYVQLDVAAGRADRPSGKRQHVFDFVDGVRLIVSREKGPDGQTFEHFSISYWPDTPIYRKLTRDHLSGVPVATAILREATIHWRVLSGSERTPEFLAFSPDKGIPHFRVPEVV